VSNYSFAVISGKKYNKLMSDSSSKISISHILFTFLSLGLIAFGGPTAHLSLFKKEFVDKFKWLTTNEYVSLISLCQILPGPTSSQVGFSIGYIKRGWLGAFAAWLGFTFPAFCIVVFLGFGILSAEKGFLNGVALGVSAVVVPIVAQAVLSMTMSFCKTFTTLLIAFSSFVLVLLFPSPGFQVLVILLSGLFGLMFLEPPQKEPSLLNFKVNQSFFSIVALFGFFVFLALSFFPVEGFLISIFSGFYRAGALVFGGGHVVLPFLKSFFVDSNFVSLDEFLTGYGLVQAIPGPLFAISGYLGMLLGEDYSKGPQVLIALFALISIFLPTFLIIPGCLHIWHRLQRNIIFFKMGKGVNAGVVGLLLANFINPILFNMVQEMGTLFLIIISSLLLFISRLPTWSIVILMGLIGFLLSITHLI